jgi:AcrR family transcriptional regulator
MKGLTTTSIAHRAGISTATVYRHFPDKHAVLRALVLDLHEERAAAVTALYAHLADAPDWRAPLREATLAAYRMRLSRPGGRSTRRALQTSPELWLWDQRQNEEIARILARSIRKRRSSLGRAEAERIALSVITASVAVLDLACLDARRGAAFVHEATVLREAYLARYLD